MLVAPPTTTATTTYGTPVTVPVPAGGACSGCAYAVGTAPAKGSLVVDADHRRPDVRAGAPAPRAATPGPGRSRTPPRGCVVTGTVTMTVGPDAVDDTAAVLLGSTVDGDLAANDSCPATCTRTVVSGPTSGSVVLRADGTYTFAPGAVTGPATFAYRVTSTVSGSTSDTATVTVAVSGARDDVATTPAGQPVVVDVRANDPCGACTAGPVGTPDAGTADAVAGGVRYTPPAGFSGTATFAYDLLQAGAVSRATVRVTVLPQAVDDARHHRPRHPRGAAAARGRRLRRLRADRPRHADLGHRDAHGGRGPLRARADRSRLVHRTPPPTPAATR